MERLDGLDGAFVSLESPTTHLHILGALVFDPAGVDGGLPFSRIRDTIAARVHLVPRFRQRMVEVPFGLQHPSMIDDPGFDLDYHVRRVALPRPGGRSELAALVADLASRPLDRRRPLWEFHVVEGLEHGQVALVPKVHHSIIDGVSGAEVLAAFFDLSPDPTPRPLFGPRRRRPVGGPDGAGGAGPGDGPEGRPVDPSWSPAAPPSALEVWRDVLGSVPGQADAVARAVSRTVRTVRALRTQNGEAHAPPPPAPFAAPRTSINRAISPRRRVALAELSRAEVDRVRDVLGGTVNDVVLTVVGGAMRSFFARRGEQPETSLVAMVPVSVRRPEDQGTLGNRVSALLVSLADGADDPAMRLDQIRRGMASAKAQSRSIDAAVFAGWAEATVPAVATRLSRLITNVRLFDHLDPTFNLIVSNVPGPQFPLYLAGAPMVAMYPVGPIIEGVGLNVTVFSYQDRLFVGLLGCWDLVPDIEVIAEGVRVALDELLNAAERRSRPVPWWHEELPA